MTSVLTRLANLIVDPRRAKLAGQNVVLVFVGQIAAAGAKLAAALLVFRSLGDTGFAPVAVYLTSSGMLTSLCELGMNVTCLKFTAGAPDNQWPTIAGRFFRLRVVLTAGVLVPVFVWAGFLSGLLLHESSYAKPLRYACVTALVGSMSSFAGALMQSRTRFRALALWSCAGGALQVTPVLALSRFEAAFTALFIGDLLNRLALIGGALPLLQRARADRFSDPEAAPPYRAIAAFAGWITVSVVIGSFQSYVPTLVLSRAGAHAELSAYVLAASIASAFALLMNTTCTVMMPEAVACTNASARLKFVRTFGPVLLAVCGLLAVATWIGAPIAKPLLANRGDAVSLLRVLGIANILLIGLNPLQFLLYSVHRADFSTLSDAVIAFGFAAVASLAVGRYRAVGVAWALLTVQTAVKAATVALIVFYSKRSADRSLARPWASVSRGI